MTTKTGLLVLLVVGCRPSPTPIKSPNENPAWSFKCESDADCDQQSRVVCPRGWDVLSSQVVGNERDAVGNASYGDMRIAPVRRLAIVCKR